MSVAGLRDAGQALLVAVFEGGVAVPIDVFKYTSSAGSLYQQRTKTYAAAVNLLGHLVVNPTVEDLSQFGSEVTADGMVVFTRTHLAVAFPLVPIAESVVVNDEIGVAGGRWRLKEVRAAARIIGGIPEVIVAIFDTKPGV